MDQSNEHLDSSPGPGAASTAESEGEVLYRVRIDYEEPTFVPRSIGVTVLSTRERDPIFEAVRRGPNLRVRS